MRNRDGQSKAHVTSLLTALVWEYGLQNILEGSIRLVSILLLNGVLLAVFIASGSPVPGIAAVTVIMLLGIVSKQFDLIGMILFVLASEMEKVDCRRGRQVGNWHRAAIQFLKDPAIGNPHVSQIEETLATCLKVRRDSSKTVTASSSSCKVKNNL